MGSHSTDFDRQAVLSGSCGGRERDPVRARALRDPRRDRDWNGVDYYGFAPVAITQGRPDAGGQTKPQAVYDVAALVGDE
ncbi:MULTISPECIES: hypothetical protein [Rhodococcus]|uniref:hypothetical protein n=1 Tax=Rhodococcus TaxID=1827 RepID=UPI00102027E5|nr:MULTISPECIES: hypothetical protein [Rhodococcus]UTT50965.1 hypothetical protein NMQ04_21740 [Rhodococcus gordoniae]